METPDGKKFGGYTTCVWCSNKGGKKDGKTFLFSFDEKKMYKKKVESKNERDIYCRKDAGPIFGGNDLYFYQTLKKGYSLSPYYFLDNNDLAKMAEEDNSSGVSAGKVFLIIFLTIAIAMLGFYLGRKYILMRRKQKIRAEELETEFSQQINNDTDYQPSKEDKNVSKYFLI